MLAEFFAQALENAQEPWRRVVGRAAELGIPTPAFSSSLAYYDGYRRARRAGQPDPGPTRPVRRPHLQAHRSRGHFHVMWGEDGREVEA